MQPLPVLKARQPNMAGSDQPAGNACPVAFDSANPVIVRPSFEVNVTGMVLVVPTLTDINGLGGVATTLSCVPFTLLGAPEKPPGVEVLPPTLVPLLVAPVPYCELEELELQPYTAAAHAAPSK